MLTKAYNVVFTSPLISLKYCKLQNFSRLQKRCLYFKQKTLHLQSQNSQIFDYQYILYTCFLAFVPLKRSNAYK